jgi:hypothetical protein
MLRQTSSRVRWEQDALGRADREMAAGSRIYVNGQGWGTYTGFLRRKVGANTHMIEFDNAAANRGAMAVQLKAEDWSVMEGEEAKADL